MTYFKDKFQKFYFFIKLYFKSDYENKVKQRGY